MTDVIRELAISIGFEVDMSGMDDVNTALEEFEERAEAGGDGADDFGDSAEGASVKTVALGNIVANAATKLAQMGLAAGKAAIKFGVDLVKGFAEAGDRIAKTGKQLGIATDDLQRLEFAAQRSGASTETLKKALRTMTVGLLDARDKGTGPMIEGLDALGLSVEDLEGKGAEERMGVLAEALKGVADEGEKAAIAAKLFGTRGGTELKPLLDEGAAGIANLGDRAEELGGVLGEDALFGAEKLTDSLLDLDTVVEGAKNRVGAQLAPAIDKLVNKFTDLISENEEFITQDLPELMEDIATATMEIVPVLIEVVQETKALIKTFTDLDNDMTNEWGPSWAIFKGAVLDVTAPIRGLISTIDALIDKARELPSVAAAIAGPAALLLGDGPQPGEEVGTVSERGVQNLGSEFQADNAKAAAVKDKQNARDAARDARAAEKAAFAAEKEEERRSGQAASDRKKQGIQGIRALGGKAKGKQRRKIDAIANAVENGDLSVSEGRAQARTIGRGARVGGGGGKKKGKKGPTISELIGNPSEDGKAGGISSIGGGASATAGAQFARIDQSFKSTTNITINLPDSALAGQAPDRQANTIGESVKAVIEKQNRLVFEHFTEVLST